MCAKMWRWVLLIFCVNLITLEARRLDRRHHGHHISTGLNGKHHAALHFHIDRDKSSDEDSDSNGIDQDTSEEDSQEKKENVCQSDACLQTARFLEKCMDTSVDPCEDFQKYACGKWAEHHEIPPYMPKWLAWDLLTSTVHKQLKGLLMEDIESKDILPVKLSKKWYKSCLNTDALERQGLRPLLNIVARNGGWPMAMAPDEWDEQVFSWQRVDKYYARLFGNIAFATWNLGPDYTKLMFSTDSESPLTLKVGTLTLPLGPSEEEMQFSRTKFYADDDYRRLIEEVVLEFVKERGIDVPREVIAKDVNDMMKFEYEIAKIYIPGMDETSFDWAKDSGEKDENDSKNSTDESCDEISEDDSDSDSDEDSDKDSNGNSDGDSDDDSNEGSDEDSDDDNSENTDEDSDDSSNNISGNDSDDSSNNISNNDSDDSSNNVSDNDSDDSSNNISDNDSNDDSDRVKRIRRRGRKASKKRTRRSLTRGVFIDYSDEEEEQEMEDDVMMAMWGNSMQAMLKEVNVKIKDIDIMNLVSPGDLKTLQELVEKTPSRIVVNYVHWTFISSVIQHTTERFRRLQFNVRGRNLGELEPPPRDIWCIDQMGTKEVISYEYVKNYFPSDAKNVANSIIRKIREVIDDRIDYSPWMSFALKRAAKEKLHAMKVEVGYPNWYDNSTAMDHYYKGLVINRNYFDNVVNFKRYDYINKFRKLDESYQLSGWAFLSPLTANAIYMPNRNSLTITAVDFQRPFFDVSQPAAVNFGIIGYMIGHEVSHGFDPEGRRYDKDGEWFPWKSRDEKAYAKREECFVKKYGDYEVELKELNTTIKVNGKRTVGDNVADCTGLQAVHGAYRLWREEQTGGEDLKLPGLEELNGDQLFFLASAALWCEKSRPEYLRYLVRSDAHSPMSVRILGAISNSEHFGEAFNCPRGSPMNPEVKCDIWK